MSGMRTLISDFCSYLPPSVGPIGRFDLRYGNLSNVRTTPSEVLSHCISLFSVPSCISLLSGSKAPIKEWVRYRYLSTYSLSEFLSHRSSLFSPFCLDGRKNWPRYRYLSDPPFRGQYSSFCPPLGRWEVLIKIIGWIMDIYRICLSFWASFPPLISFPSPSVGPDGGIDCRSWLRL